MDHPQGVRRTWPKLPLIISFLLYTFGAAEAWKDGPLGPKHVGVLIF